jgi:hypothetical protein
MLNTLYRIATTFKSGLCQSLLTTGLAALPTITGCPLPWDGASSMNPFTDLPPIPMTGQATLLDYNVAPLGQLQAGQAINVLVTGEQIQSVLILKGDADQQAVGLLAGGGIAGETFEHIINVTGDYYVFVLFEPDTLSLQQRAWLTVSLAAEPSESPRTQPVVIEFEDDFLTSPGLVDPTTFTSEQVQLLADIEPIVKEGILTRLRTIFADTPIEIYSQADALPEDEYSRVIISPQRKLADSTDYFDAIVPPVESADATCHDLVLFGELLDTEHYIDIGNHNRSDEAIVYVGSFQGRGERCQTAATDSVNHIVLGLAHTAAHEIGHLVGLFHVPLPDVMNRSPSLAFQRELSISQGQLVIESASGNFILTDVVQDPATYFAAIFSN